MSILQVIRTTANFALGSLFIICYEKCEDFTAGSQSDQTPYL